MTAALLDRSLPLRRPSPAGRAAEQSLPNPSKRRPPHLRVLDQAAARRRSRLRAALAALFVAVLVGFFAVAFVHAQLVAGQQHLDDVRTQIRDLEAGRAELIQAVEQESAPHFVVGRAIEMGMVASGTPVYLAAVSSPQVELVPGVSGVAHQPAELPPVAAPSPGVGSPVAADMASGASPSNPLVDGSQGAVVQVQVAVGSPAGISGRAASELPATQVAASPSASEQGEVTESETASGQRFTSSSSTPSSVPSVEAAEPPSLAGLQIKASPDVVSSGGMG